MNRQALLTDITRQPLLINADFVPRIEAALDGLLSHEHANEIFSSQNVMASDDDFWPPANSWMAHYRPYKVKGGVLQIPVFGLLLNRFPYQLGSFATGYTYIEQALKRGLKDDDVKGIALVVDSGGGLVSGNFELSDMIHAAREEKPIRAFVADHAYSAAYSLASAADEVTITRSGGSGSIGVVMAHMDVSKLMEDIGMKVTFVYSGKHKVDGNSYEPLPDDVKERWQGEIDKIYGVFTSTVARNRDMAEDDVRQTEALTYDSDDSVSVGLVDRVGSFDDELETFMTDLRRNDEDRSMSRKDDPAENNDTVDVEAVKAEGRAEGVTAGAKAERERINGIKALDEAKARPVAAESVAMNTSMTVEEAKTFLATLPEEAPAASASDDDKDGGEGGDTPFDKTMRKDNPDVGDGGEGSGDGPSADEAKAKELLGSYARATGA